MKFWDMRDPDRGATVILMIANLKILQEANNKLGLRHTKTITIDGEKLSLKVNAR